MAGIETREFWIRLLEKLLKQALNRRKYRDSTRRKHQHVVPHEDGWAVMGEGNVRHTAVYPHQAEAIDRAKRIARRLGSTVVIHRKDGTIRDRVY